MFPVGGVGVMLLGAAASGFLMLLVVLGLRRRVGWLAAIAGPALLWSLVVIALVTLLPPHAAPGIVRADTRLAGCSWDIGGPAPTGFWIFQSGQRALNTALFVPSGVLLVLAAARWRTGWVLVPVGLVLLAGYSAAIEVTQLKVARLDRACDVTDFIDNVSGAAIGVGVGLVLALVLRPWRRRGRSPRRLSRVAH